MCMPYVNVRPIRYIAMPACFAATPSLIEQIPHSLTVGEAGPSRALSYKDSVTEKNSLN